VNALREGSLLFLGNATPLESQKAILKVGKFLGNCSWGIRGKWTYLQKPTGAVLKTTECCQRGMRNLQDKHLLPQVLLDAV